MRIVIEYQGKTYEGECSPLEKPDKYANELYEHLEEMTKLRMRLAQLPLVALKLIGFYRRINGNLLCIF